MGEGSPYELSATQAHLALRRRAMKDLGFLRRGACTLRRTQVWLELLRIYYEGPHIWAVSSLPALLRSTIPLGSDFLMFHAEAEALGEGTEGQREA